MSIALASTSTPNAMRQEPLRVMVVDDSVVIRGLIARWLGSEPDMVVAASLRTGLDAVNQIERVNPDVALLDIEMPDLDGISALPLLLAKKPNLIIIMAHRITFQSPKAPAKRARPKSSATISLRKFVSSAPRSAAQPWPRRGRLWGRYSIGRASCCAGQSRNRN
jgi:CheY-like chemotaxis protein